jgi:hypothetical protein
MRILRHIRNQASTLGLILDVRSATYGVNERGEGRSGGHFVCATQDWVRCTSERCKLKFGLEVFFAKLHFADFGVCADVCGGGSLPGTG